jgi:hypothetical protein
MTCVHWRVLCLLLAAACVACTPMHSRIKPPYVVDGVTYDDEAGLQRYAAAQCSAGTADAPQPPHPFTTDGCSLWPDGAWRECCIVHDVSYWCGGPATRREADRRLRACVDERSGAVNPLLMYYGVRLGGSRWVPLPWRWGYGYPWPYRAPAEKDPPQQERPAISPPHQDAR